MKSSKRKLYEKPLPDIEIPDLVTGAKPLSYFEFWPPRLFYLPMQIYTAYLAIRYKGLTTGALANPLIYAGGFIGESKFEILEMVPDEKRKYFADYAILLKSDNNENDFLKAKRIIEENSLKYPMVAKPDKGERGVGVQVIFDNEELLSYIESFPESENIFFQQMYDYPSEAGVFYIRHPDEVKGRIFSLTLKYFPKVIGDGKSTLRELIMADERAARIPHIYLNRHKEYLDEILAQGKEFRLAFSGSHSRGAIFKDGTPFITEKMEQAWDSIAREIPELYFCRFDVRFHKMEDLETLENMKIIEINGAGAEATHIWDSKMSLSSAYKTLMKQYKTMFEIGHKNKKRGFKTISTSDFRRLVKENKLLKSKFPDTY